jgi:hypothetical protein
MKLRRFVVLIDGPAGPTLLMRDGTNARVFPSVKAAHDAMDGHLLRRFPWEAIDLEDFYDSTSSRNS